jgi:hypothetical protein
MDVHGTKLARTLRLYFFRIHRFWVSPSPMCPVASPSLWATFCFFFNIRFMASFCTWLSIEVSSIKGCYPSWAYTS